MLSRVDIQGSFGDHTFTIEHGFLPATAVFSLEHLRAMRLDPSAVWRGDISAYEASRNSGQVFVIPHDTFSDMLGRLVVHEIRLDGFLECGIECNRASLRAGILSSDMRAMVRIRRIVWPAFPREHLQLVPH